MSAEAYQKLAVCLRPSPGVSHLIASLSACQPTYRNSHLSSAAVLTA
jgi:hypothetical protein